MTVRLEGDSILTMALDFLREQDPDSMGTTLFLEVLPPTAFVTP